MRLPVIKSKSKYMRRIVAFGGINLTQSFSEGEMRDCSGISHEMFPSLTQTRKRIDEFRCNNPTAMIFAGKECIACDGALYYDRKKVGELGCGKKCLAYIGNRIIVFPDKVYYDTAEEKFASIENLCDLSNLSVTFEENSVSVPENACETISYYETLELGAGDTVFKYSSVTINSDDIKLYGAEVITADNLCEGDIFSEISGNAFYRTVKVINSDEEKIIVENEKTTVRNIGKNMFEEFRKGDIVSILGSELAENNRDAEIVSSEGNRLVFAEGTFTANEETSGIVIKRKIPDFSCICTYENRLWGCEGNTVYASKPGEPFNFFTYDNLSTDSFAVTSNTPESFTAAVVYGNYCLFFKEDNCYKLYGTRPANFQLVECYAGGISEKDCESVTNFNGRLFYKGNGGVFSFYGGTPQCISNKLGQLMIENCAGGGNRRCYYLCGDTDNGREEFVFDTENNFWSKSGVRNVNGYFSYGEEVYRLMPQGIEKISTETDSETEWFAEFCLFDEGYHNTKNYSRLYITAQLYDNAWIRAEISCDGEPWKNVMTKYGRKKEHITIPCTIKNCYEVNLRLSGKGRSVIESVVREFTVNQR